MYDSIVIGSGIAGSVIARELAERMNKKVLVLEQREHIGGNCYDEYDEHDEEIKLIKDDEYIIEGATKIEDVNEMLGTKFESEDFDSIGGFIIETFGKFPDKDDTIKIGSVKFIVEEIEKNRIEKLRALTGITDIES